MKHPKLPQIIFKSFHILNQQFLERLTGRRKQAIYFVLILPLNYKI